MVMLSEIVGMRITVGLGNGRGKQRDCVAEKTEHSPLSPAFLHCGLSRPEYGQSLGRADMVAHRVPKSQD